MFKTQPERKKPRGTPGCTREDNIKLYLEEIGRGWGGGLDASGSGQGPVDGAYEHENEPSRSTEGGELLEQQTVY
jgi:hypothetical protein